MLNASANNVSGAAIVAGPGTIVSVGLSLPSSSASGVVTTTDVCSDSPVSFTTVTLNV